MDCQMLIVKNLNSADLVSLSQTSEYCSSLVVKHLRPEFATKNVIIEVIHTYDTNFMDYIKGIDYITVRNTIAIKEIIKKFGRSIQKLSLSGNMGFYGDGQLNLQQMFPSLRRLKLIGVLHRNISKSGLKLPHLEHLEAEITNSHGYLNETVIMELIKLNPQILSIELKRVNENMLKFISIHSPRLEKLTISSYQEEHPIPIHFEHLKCFKISESLKQSVPTGITFGGNFEELEINAYPQDHKYTDLIVNNKNLRKIRVYWHYGLDNNDILRIKLANLSAVEMSILCFYDVKEETIITLIEDSETLNRLHLRRLKSTGMVVWLFRSLELEWTVDRREASLIADDYYLVRKNPVL